jgi:uncharacterized membrane protein
MPYCCQCGKQTRDNDVYCGVCGARQPVSAQPKDAFSPRTASILCYIPVVGWIPAIIVLASQRFRHDAVVRFHAFQGIFLFVVWLVLDWALGPMHGFMGWGRGSDMMFGPWFMIGGVLKGALMIAWIVMLVKTSQGEVYRLPILGELADRSVAEQK